MTFADHSKEIRTYKDNRLNGPANIFMANGDRIELIYQVKSLVIFHASFCIYKKSCLTVVKDTWIASVKSGYKVTVVYKQKKCFSGIKFDLCLC